MPRLMSVAYTEDAVRERRKTVTRRKGWLMLKPGDRLTLVRKSMGRKKGEPLVRVAEVEVVSVRREPLMWLYGTEEGPLAAYLIARHEGREWEIHAEQVTAIRGVLLAVGLAADGG